MDRLLDSSSSSRTGHLQLTKQLHIHCSGILRKQRWLSGREERAGRAQNRFSCEFNHVGEVDAISTDHVLDTANNTIGDKNSNRLRVNYYQYMLRLVPNTCDRDDRFAQFLPLYRTFRYS